MGTTDDITTTIFQQKANARSRLKQKSKTDIDDRLTCEKQLKSLQNELKEIKSNKVVEEQMRNENDHLSSEMDKTTNEKYTLQEDIKKWRLNSEKMKSVIEDLKERLKKEPEKSEMFNYNQQLKNEVESLKRANSLMRDNSNTDKTNYQEKVS